MLRRLRALLEKAVADPTAQADMHHERLALIAKHTSNAVNVLDARGRIQWVNEGFERITGYSFAEAVGRTPGSLLRSEDTDPAAAAAIDDAILAGRPIRQDILNRGKHGRSYWLDVEIAPLRDGDGTLTGFMAIETDISESMNLRAALKAYNADLEMISTLAGVGAWHLDVETKDLWWSDEVRRIHELDDDFVLTLESGLSFYDNATRARLDTVLSETIELRLSHDVEISMTTAKGNPKWVRVVVRPVVVNGAFRKIVGAYQDISASVAAREALKRTQERLELAVRSAGIGLWDWNAQTREMWINQDWWEHLGYPGAPVSVATSANLVHPDDLEGVYARWNAFVANPVGQLVSEYRYLDAMGTYRWIQTVGRVIERGADGQALRMSGVQIDIDARRTAEEQRRRDQEHLWSLANLDILTQVPNRARFFSELGRTIAEFGGSGQRIAVGLVDLDRFKEVNDSFGHAIGDELLIKVAAVLTANVGPNEMVARLSGDEFAFFILGVADDNAVEERLKQLLNALCAPISLSNLAKRGGGSIGVALYPDDAEAAEELMRRADMALYAAKTSGRQSWQRFAAPMEARINIARSVRHEFEAALQTGQVFPFYQPIIAADESAIRGFEALARWRHPTKGIVGPSEFLSALTEPELARLLGRQIRSNVIAQVGLWRTQSVPFGQISINAVAADFVEGELVPDLLAAIRNREIRPGELCVEITEGVLLEGGHGARLRLDLVALRDAGIEIAFDDFGTGFASLSHLREFPIDRMKVDRSFVLNLPGSARDIEIVRTIGTLAGALGIRLTAEGVETEAQADTVRKLGATELQGFLFSKAMHPDRVPGYISRFVSASRPQLMRRAGAT